MTRVWVVVALLLLGGVVNPADAALRAGVGKAEITPPVGTPLGGYGDRNGAPSTGAHDPLFAKALVLEDGGTRVAIVTTDLIGTNPAVTREVLARTGYPAARLLLSASHTHSGPGAFGKGLFAKAVLGDYDERIFNLLVERIVAAVKAAEAKLGPARLGVSVTELPQGVRNRRRNAYTDADLTLVRVDTAAGKPLAALVHFSAHGTVLGPENLQASGDWMGVTQAAIEKAMPGVVALYANGAEGDLSPVPPGGARGFEGIEAQGQLVAQAVLAQYRTTPTTDAVPISVQSDKVIVPTTLGGAALGAGQTTPIQTVGVGGMLLISVPGEMTSDLGMQIKSRARARGWRHPVVVGLANDHLGYFLSRKEFRKGGYEATISFFGAGFGETLTAEIVALVEKHPLPAGLQPPPPAKATPEELARVRQWVAAPPVTPEPAEAKGEFGVEVDGVGLWRVAVAEGKATAEKVETQEKADATLRATPTVWARLLRGDLRLEEGFRTGLIRIDGDLGSALQFGRWLGIGKKVTP